jgi:hypothetical protein
MKYFWCNFIPIIVFLFVYKKYFSEKMTQSARVTFDPVPIEKGLKACLESGT